MAGCGGSHSAARHDGSDERVQPRLRGTERALRGAPVRKLVPGRRGHARRARAGCGACALRRRRRAARRPDRRRHVTRRHRHGVAGRLAAGRSPPAASSTTPPQSRSARSRILFGGGNGPARSTRSSGSIRAPAPPRRSATCRPAAPTRRARRSAARRTSSAATRARAGSTRSSRGSREAARDVVAHLPAAVRYAAVTSVAGRLVIAGGSLESGSATDAVYEYVPSTGRVSRIGRLPAPTTHAAAATFGSIAYVVGGRGASSERRRTASSVSTSRSARWFSRARSAQPLSDLMAVGTPRGILVDRRQLERHRGGRHRRRHRRAPAARRRPDARRRPRSRACRRSSTSSNVYAADRAGNLSPVVRNARPYVYVPNSDSNTVDVIDQRTFKIVRHFAVGALPQHIVPAYDLKTLYVTNDNGNSLTPIDPNTGKPRRRRSLSTIRTTCTSRPTGATRSSSPNACTVSTFAMRTRSRCTARSTVPCSGADHMDFSADGSYALVSCEFSGDDPQGRHPQASASSTRCSCGPALRRRT